MRKRQFCQKLGKSASKMFQMIKQVYGKEALGCSAVFLPANIFQQCFQQLCQCWQTCMAANGNYFEGGCGYVCVYLVICIIRVPAEQKSLPKRQILCMVETEKHNFHT
jgi:hypothetical protein